MPTAVNSGYYTIDSHVRDWFYFLRLAYTHPIRSLVNRYRWYKYPGQNRVVDFPDHVDIEVVGACNMVCPMCFRQTKAKYMKNFGRMDYELYTKIIDQCVENKVFSIKLSWRGESTLHPQLPEMVAYAKKKGIPEVAFLTNGLKLDDELIEGLVLAGLDWLSVSFDGLGETYEAIRKPSKYDEALVRLKRIREIRRKHWRIRPLVRVQSIWSAIKDNPDEYFAVMRPLVDKVNFIPDVAHLQKQDHDPGFICGYPWQRLTITWDGKIPLCIGDLKEMYMLGDAKTDRLHDVWHGEKMQHARKLHHELDRLKLRCCAICHQGRKTTTLEDGTVIDKNVGNQRRAVI